MNKTVWTGVIVAIVFAGGGFYGGMQYQASQTPARAAGFTAGAGGTFAGRGGAGFAGATGGAGGATVGTIIATGSGSFTIQLPTSTSTTATTGTKIVLVDNATQIQALESVPASSLSVGQTVTVAGTTNFDGSVTASTVMVRPASTGARGSGGATTQTTGQ